MKLSAVGVSARQLSAHPLVKQHLLKKHPARHLGNIYFDTPELSLQSSLIGLRLRRDGDRWLQTVKTSGSASGGMHHRGEWEMAVAGEALELARFDAKPLRKLFDDKKLAASLAPVFRTDFERTTWDLQFDDGSLVELVLDQGEVKAGRRTEAIAEVELELKRGESWRLFEFARALSERLPLRILNASKAARGYRLAGHAPPYRASEAGVLSMAGQSLSSSRPHSKSKSRPTAEQALIAGLHHHLNHLQANEVVLLKQPDDVDSVHQALTACGRLQAMLELYAALLPTKSVTGIRADLDWLSAELQRLHDRDRFGRDSLGVLAHWLPQHRGLDALQRRLGRQRREHWQRLCEALESPRYSRWMLDFGLWLERGDWRSAAGKAVRKRLDKKASAYLKQQLAELQQWISAQAARGKPLSARQRTRLLSRCRTLDVALDVGAALNGGEAGSGSSGYRDALTGLQRALETFEQTPVRLRLLADLGGARKAPAADLVTGWLLAEQNCAPVRLAEAAAELLRHQPVGQGVEDS